MISSLQTKLVLAVSVLAVAAVAAVALSARQWTRLEFRKFQELDHQSGTVRRTSAAAVAAALDRVCCDTASLARAHALVGADAVGLVLGESGEFVAATGPRAHELRKVSASVGDGVLAIDMTRERGGVADSLTLQFRGASPAMITLADGRAASVVIVSLPTETVPPDAAFFGSIDRRLLLATVVVSIAAIGLTWVLARRIVRPIGELERAAGDLARGNLARRVDVGGSDEMAGLARSFNAMAANLERQQSRQRGLVHDVAHELRTPLTALQCRLETIIDGLAADPPQALAGAHEEVRHLARLVDDLEVVALAEAREIRLSIADVNVADVVASAARGAELAAPRLRVDVEPALSVQADVVRLRQVLINLLANADRHTPPGGTITVRARRQGTDVAVDVHNTGSALDADAIAQVFDRFYRADPSRQRATGGSGLGLAIVKHLVEAQGGRVGVTSDGTGVTFSFTTPADQRPRPDLRVSP